MVKEKDMSNDQLQLKTRRDAFIRNRLENSTSMRDISDITDIQADEAYAGKAEEELFNRLYKIRLSLSLALCSIAWSYVNTVVFAYEVYLSFSGKCLDTDVRLIIALVLRNN